MWKVLGNVSPTELLDARLEMHHAVQWVARATRAYCKVESDDSHTSLSWDSDAQALMGRSLSPDLTLGLRLEDLTFVAQSNRENETYSLIGQTERVVGKWLAELVERNGLDPKKLNDPGPYSLESHSLDSGGMYGIADRKG